MDPSPHPKNPSEPPDSPCKRPNVQPAGSARGVDRPHDGKQPTPARNPAPWDDDRPHDGKHPSPAADGTRWDVRRPVRWPDRDVSGRATRRKGLTDRSELLAMGLTRAVIDNAVERGRLVIKHRGVYAVGHLALPPGATELAAVMAVGEGAVLSHRSAAVLWQLIPATRSDRDRGAGGAAGGEADVDVTVAGRDAGRRRAGIRVHRVKWLDPADVTVRDDIPVTTAARAMLDVTPLLAARELERAFDRGLKSRVVTVRDVIAALARSPRHPGAPRLAALASAERPASTETRSRNEERLLRLVRSGGLPLPELNVPVGPYIVDALWRDLRLVVEVDSYEYHGTRWSFEADRARDLALGTTGYRVIRFTADQVEHRAAWVLVNLAQELTRRPPHHG